MNENTTASSGKAASALVYLTQMSYPSKAAHSIQISRTVAALGKLIPVIVVVKHLEADLATAEKQYGLDFGKQVRFIQCNPRFGKLGMMLLAWKLSRLAGGPFVFYTRTYSFARKLIGTRGFHKRRVYFESHKKMGYYKEDVVSNSNFTTLRKEEESKNEPLELIQSVYRESDGVSFLHDHSREIAAKELGLKNAIWNWYGVDVAKIPEKLNNPAFDFIYCGSVTRDKLVELLLEAAAKVNQPFVMHIYGKCDDATKTWFEADLEKRGLTERVQYKGFISFSELQKRLPEYRSGIATMQGIKVVDYIENGLTLIIPEIVSHTEVFRADEVVYFTSDDATDLARAMTESLATGPRRQVSRASMERFSLEQRARRMADAIQ